MAHKGASSLWRRGCPRVRAIHGRRSAHMPGALLHASPRQGARASSAMRHAGSSRHVVLLESARMQCNTAEEPTGSSKSQRVDFLCSGPPHSAAGRADHRIPNQSDVCSRCDLAPCAHSAAAQPTRMAPTNKSRQDGSLRPETPRERCLAPHRRRRRRSGCRRARRQWTILGRFNVVIGACWLRRPAYSAHTHQYDTSLAGDLPRRRCARARHADSLRGPPDPSAGRAP